MLASFRRNVLMPVNRIFDLAVVCIVFPTAIAISAGPLTWPGLAEVLVMRIKVANLFLFGGYLILCSVVFSACGFYRSHRLSHWNQRLSEILFAVTFVTAVLLTLRWILDLMFATNEFLLVFWLLTLSTLVLSRGIAWQLLHLARSRGRNLRNVIIIGEGPYAAALANRIRQEGSLGYRLLRIIDAGELTGNGRNAGDI
jgi:FlaA1/EpsC-like NDP-sugar epimerase